MRIMDANDHAIERQHIVPGMPLGIEITDADMNILPHALDRVGLSIAVQNGENIFVIAEETNPNSGIFIATFDTIALGQKNTPEGLPVESGDIIEILYQDTRTEFAEQNQTVTKHVAVGWSVERLARIVK